jgi:hypothetical protein
LTRHWQKAAWALLAAPVCAFGFDAVDVLTPASSGLYPAYPPDPAPPYSVWAQAGLMYDSNLLRLPSGSNDDLVTRAGLGGRIDQRIVGRQTLHAEGRVDGYLYDRYSALNNVAYAGLAEWRYELGNDLAGTLTASRRRYEASLAEIQAPLYDPITETALGATARYAVGPNVRLRGGLNYVHADRPARDFVNIRTLTGVGALEYVTALNNMIGIEVQEAKGDAPVDQFVDPLRLFVNNDFRQRDVSLIGAWGASPTLHVAGRVGRTTRSYTELTGRDFSGPTWSIAAQWFPTAKTVIALESAKTLTSVIDIGGASHVVGKGWAVGPGWAVTAKLNLQARYFKQHQEFLGDPNAALGLTPIRQEEVSGVRLGAYWEYNRRLHYQLSVEHGNRDSNFAGRDYSYNAGIAQVRFVF